ncbi:MAG: hypothetical protein ACRC2T_08215 [Thermoguttaceae bacterium]
MFSNVGKSEDDQFQHWKTREQSRPTGGGRLHAKRTAHAGLRYNNA